jgi:hypothetical protein
MFAGFDDACCDLHPHRRNGLHLTDNDVAISRIESKLLEPLSVNVKKGATGRQRIWRPVAKARFRGRKVTGRAFTLPIQRKIA